MTMRRQLGIVFRLASLLALAQWMTCCQASQFGVVSSRALASSRPLPSSPDAHHEFDDMRVADRQLLWSVRGGSMEVSDDDDDDDSKVAGGMLVSKIRNVIRNLMNFGDDKVPLLSQILRPCFGMIESLTGLQLLPQKATPMIKKQRKSSKKSKSGSSSSSKSKTKSKSKSLAEADESGDGEDTESTADSETKASKKTKETKSGSKKKKTNEKRKPKPSATTQKHLSSQHKVTSPIYRIQRELKEFIKSPPQDLSVQVGSNIRLWVVTMRGSKGSIYEGEVYKLRIQFPKNYPLVPPSVYFLKGYIPVHEHVYTNGDICLSMLGKGWKPNMTAQSIAQSIHSILSSAQSKNLPMDNAAHATNKPGQYQKDWVYHDDNC